MNPPDSRPGRPGISRTAFLRGAAGALGVCALGQPLLAQNTPEKPEKMLTRPIPSTGAPLPVVGCGTWRTFDVGSGAAERAPLADVLRVLFEAGGTVIDSSPMYGAAEGVVGGLLTASQ